MKKIVIMRRGGLGDFITGTVPLCEYFREIYGECDFHFFMTSSNIGIAKYYYPECKTYLVPVHNRLYHHTRLGLKYRSLKADIGFITVPDYPRFDSLFLYCIGAKERYGRIGKSPIAKLLLNHASPLYDDVDNSEDHDGLCALRIFDPNIKKIEERFFPKFRKDLLTEFKPKFEGPYIMVELSNHRPTSQLSIEKTALILNKLFEKHKFSVLITAVSKDKDKTEKLLNRLQMDSENYISDSLEGFLAYVNAADIVMCGDGGLAHIAGSMDKKVLALHGKITVEHWAPLGKYVKTIYDSEDVNNIENNKILKELNEFIASIN